MSETVKLTAGKSVTVSEFTLDDISEARKWVDAVKSQVNWASLDNLTAGEAVILLASKFPSVAAKVIAHITGSELAGVKKWPITDVLKVLNKWLEANHFDEAIQEGSVFFARLGQIMNALSPAQEPSEEPQPDGGSKT